MNKDLKEKFAFTLAEGATHVGIFHITRRVAFTLAEVLITLGIIGIVSAMTIPTLINNYQKKVTVAKLQKVHAVLNQIARSAIANDLIKGFTAGQEVTAEKTEEFFNEFIFSQLKSPKVILRGADIYSDCEAYNACYKYLNTDIPRTSQSISTSYPSGHVLFSTSDNIIYFMETRTFDNKYNEAGELIQSTQIYRDDVNVWVDINGVSGPDTFGKDIFLFEADFSQGVARPAGYNQKNTEIDANCSKSGGGTNCASKIMRDGWQIKDDYPW